VHLEVFQRARERTEDMKLFNRITFYILILVTGKICFLYLYLKHYWASS